MTAQHLKTNRFFSCKACCFKSPGHEGGGRGGLRFNKTLQGVRYWGLGRREGGGGDSSPLCSFHKAPVPFRVGWGVGSGWWNIQEFLEREGPGPVSVDSLSLGCGWGSFSFPGKKKCRSGLAVTVPEKSVGLWKFIEKQKY